MNFHLESGDSEEENESGIVGELEEEYPDESFR